MALLVIPVFALAWLRRGGLSSLLAAPSPVNRPAETLAGPNAVEVPRRDHWFSIHTNNRS